MNNKDLCALVSGIWYLACEYKIMNAVLSYALFEQCREGISFCFLRPFIC